MDQPFETLTPFVRLAFAAGKYFDVEAPSLGDLGDLGDLDAIDFTEHGQSVLRFVARVEAAVDHPTELIDRLHRSAVYVAKVEGERASAIDEERQSKAAFLAALINAVEPALPAISEPLIHRRKFEPGMDERRWTHRRGVYLVDGWKRGQIDGDAGTSLVLEEDGSLWVHEHHAYDPDDHEGDGPPGGYEIHTNMRAVSIVEALDVFPRKSFIEAVDKLVTKVWKLARNPKRKAQTKESLALADKLAAVRVLLQQGGA